MKLLILLIVLSIVLSGNIRQRVYYEYSFENYIRKYNKLYGTPEEYIYRLQIYANNLDIIDNHNSLESSYKLGANKFADLTNQEFTSLLSGRKKINEKSLSNIQPKKTIKDDVPESLDWVELGAVTRVKDQGSCGSCWAFSVVGGLESLNYLKNKELIEFSEQELVDCSGSYGNQGCNGGLEKDGYEYVKDNSICLEDDYPYHALDEKCKSNLCKKTIKTTGYIQVPRGENGLLEAIIKQPISVAINASPIQLYDKGIYDGECPSHPFYLNHAVLGVGYGIENNIKYWKIKNSWGSDWGEKGYFRIAKEVDNYPDGMCGLAIDNTYPTM